MASIKRTEHHSNQPSYAFEATASGFHGAEDSTIPLWRYMDFTKFVSMLESRSIYFCRTDLLGDDFEGSLTRAEAEERERFESRLREQHRALVLHKSVGPKVRSEVQNSIVSCWHMNEYESMAMWRLYLTGTGAFQYDRSSRIWRPALPSSTVETKA